MMHTYSWANVIVLMLIFGIGFPWLYKLMREELLNRIGFIVRTAIHEELTKLSLSKRCGKGGNEKDKL